MTLPVELVVTAAEPVPPGPPSVSAVLPLPLCSVAVTVTGCRQRADHDIAVGVEWNEFERVMLADAVGLYECIIRRLHLQARHHAAERHVDDVRRSGGDRLIYDGAVSENVSAAEKLPLCGNLIVGGKDEIVRSQAEPQC